jgi:hypothetical protein
MYSVNGVVGFEVVIVAQLRILGFRDVVVCHGVSGEGVLNCFKMRSLR